MFRIVRLAQEEVPQSELLRFYFQVLDDGDDGLPPALWISRNLGMGDVFCRETVFLLLCALFVSCITCRNSK